MGLQNLDITSTMLHIGVQLKTDKRIIAFCKERFPGKELHVLVGDITRKYIPTYNETPYIIVTDFSKQEGQNIEFCPYEFTLWVGVGKEEPEFIEADGVKIMDAFKDCADFMTIIEDVFNDAEINNRPCAKVNTNGPFPIDPAGRHWAGKIKVNKRIYQTLGGNYTEEL